jgi:hypothetical protein
LDAPGKPPGETEIDDGGGDQHRHDTLFPKPGIKPDSEHRASQGAEYSHAGEIADAAGAL